ncbi:MAG TPA: DUF3566 domain-containing protein [Blastococcus sp.]|jgi:hypothetical protein
MSDRTQSSVRTGFRTGDAAAPTETAAAGEPVPVSSTQSIPTTGSQRAQSADGGATSAPGSSVPPAGGPPGAPPVPPAADRTAFTAGAAPAVATVVPSKGRGRGSAKSRGPRRARLQLRHIDTWSALKISLVLSIALFFIWMVAVAVLYGVLSALGVFQTLNDLFGQLGSASGSKGGGGDVITPGLVFWGAAVIGAINVVLMTALCTVGTFIYNLCSDLVGGLELTLSERD